MRRFIHITGSVQASDGPEAVRLVRQLVHELSFAFLGRDCGLVALVGASLTEDTVAFDRVIIRTVADFLRSGNDGDGALLKTVRRSDTWLERTGNDILRELQEIGDRAVDEAIEPDDYTGGYIRATQFELADAVVVIGGSRGVHDTVDLMLNDGRVVEEILVRGLTGGLNNSMRARLDDIRGCMNRPDNRTVLDSSDCAPVAERIAQDIVSRMEKREELGDSESQGVLQKVRSMTRDNRTPSWLGAGIGLFRLFKSFVS